MISPQTTDQYDFSPDYETNGTLLIFQASANVKKN